MVFQPNPYSVLVVSASGRLLQNLQPLLPPGEFDPVQSARSAAEAKRRLLERDFDLILINSPLPDGPSLDLAAGLCAETEAGVLLLTQAESYEEVTAQAQPSGVLTLYKPSSRQMVALTLHALCALRERLRKQSRRQQTVEEKIQELRLINRAKWLLIEARRLTEPEAHRALERLAMERRITKKQAAEQVIEEYA